MCHPCGASAGVETWLACAVLAWDVLVFALLCLASRSLPSPAEGKGDEERGSATREGGGGSLMKSAKDFVGLALPRLAGTMGSEER